MTTNSSLVSIANLSREKILYLMEMAHEFELRPNRKLLDGRIVAHLVFRAQHAHATSFETAANRLGARVIGFTDPKVTSSTKGETLKDTIMMVANYSDVIVMRHYLEGAALYASELTSVPVVNAGRRGAPTPFADAARPLHHDADAGHARQPAHSSGRRPEIWSHGSLAHHAMRHFNPTFHFIAPAELAMPDEYKQYCREHGISLWNTSILTKT